MEWSEFMDVAITSALIGGGILLASNIIATIKDMLNLKDVEKRLHEEHGTLSAKHQELAKGLSAEHTGLKETLSKEHDGLAKNLDGLSQKHKDINKTVAELLDYAKAEEVRRQALESVNVANTLGALKREFDEIARANRVLVTEMDNLKRQLEAREDELRELKERQPKRQPPAKPGMTRD
ncbi:hypothetical protein FACS1894217_13370 [Clostridia bacterium]|nr:hypothetical protein FACS1894217_13370 [Clostridia bacterium]